MNDKTQNSKFDLEERTAKFGEAVVTFCKAITLNDISRPIVGQLIRSATSIGANYMEANGADSGRDFHSKIGISKKESKETMHWLRMLGSVDLNSQLNEIRLKLWQEAKELSLIFGAINRN